MATQLNLLGVHTSSLIVNKHSNNVYYSEDKKSARESIQKDCVTIIELPGNKYLGFVPVDDGSEETIADAIFAYENIC